MDEPAIRNEEAFTVVGIGGRFISVLSPEATNDAVIPELWHSFIKKMNEVPNRSDSSTWGVCLSLPDPSTPGEYRYVAGAPVSSVDEIPEGMEAVEIPSATYAVFTHNGRIDAIAQAYRHIHGEWLPASGFRHAGGPELERYDERFTGGEDSAMEIWIPVTR